MVAANKERIRKNVFIGDHRTSISLETHYWNGLVEICRREQVDLDGLCTNIVSVRNGESSMSSAIRVVSPLYFQFLAEDTRQKLLAAAKGARGASIAQSRSLLKQVLKSYATT